MLYEVTVPCGVDASDFVQQHVEFAESDFADLVELQKAILKLNETYQHFASKSASLSKHVTILKGMPDLNQGVLQRYTSENVLTTAVKELEFEKRCER